jgi:hypothetical protein
MNVVVVGGQARTLRPLLRGGPQGLQRVRHHPVPCASSPRERGWRLLWAALPRAQDRRSGGQVSRIRTGFPASQKFNENVWQMAARSLGLASFASLSPYVWAQSSPATNKFIIVFRTESFGLLGKPSFQYDRSDDPVGETDQLIMCHENCAVSS